MTNPLSFV